MYAATNRRRTGRDEIRLKAKALRAAQRRLAQLQAENDWLRWQHALIAELCKGFDWFRNFKLHALLADPDAMQERSHSTSSTNSSHISFPAKSAKSDSSEQPIAPPDDPLYLFQHVFSQPAPALVKCLETVTLQELRSNYKALVCDLSLYLMQHQTGGMAAEDRPLDKLQAALIEHLRLMSEMCIANSSLVTACQLSNCETGEQLTEPPTARIRWVVERLELSQQQQCGIARGMCVFKKLLTPLLEELRQLQQQHVEECPSSSAEGSEGADELSGCSAAADTASLQYSVSGERGRVLEQQEQRSGRMQLLLHKDFFLRTWFCCYLYGQLSWVQLARMHVLMLPFYPVPYVFFKEIEAHVAERLTQRAEEQQQDSKEDEADEDGEKGEGSNDT
ncbi:hypothetical protein OEZ85_010935 [Tetradesmus obliquus]|uniref:BZIP domain-containing protein n=1 Tax=Tetradesmus obliquus TaxID=3088 RepID=A0ABY8TNS4_TETOB|nr:hypothetical protein OEZ85_010935 [Tetradesmus obliquus]